MIEEALQHHLQVLREIPEDLIIPSRLVLTEEAMKQVKKQLAADNKPTEALKGIFNA